MKIGVVAVGRLKAGPERELVDRYAERLTQTGRGLGLSGPAIVDIAESQARAPQERKAQEGAAILAAVSPDSAAVVFDERGSALSSDQFAEMLGAWRDGGRRGVVCVVGGADGLSAAVLSRADRIVSLGRMTMPHQLARIVVLEQLYRAATILSGHPYHRA